MTQTSTDEYAKLVKELQTDLEATTVQDIRKAARLWGWRLKGTIKADIVKQMLAFLTDVEHMRAEFSTLPVDEQTALIWLTAIAGRNNPGGPLQTVLSMVSGRKLSKQAAKQIIDDLGERCLLFFGRYSGCHVPRVYSSWLPEVAAPRLVYERPVEPAPVISVGILNTHVERLLSNIQAYHPPVSTSPEALVLGKPAPMRNKLVVLPRPGLLSTHTLAQWGYVTQEDQDLARTLLDLMFSGGLLRITKSTQGKRLGLNSRAAMAWQDTPPVVRQQELEAWWLAHPERGGSSSARTKFGWNELDQALSYVKSYTLYQTARWYSSDLLASGLYTTRRWLLRLVQLLQADTWYSFDRFCRLVYSLHRDLFQWTQSYAAWVWYRDRTQLDPAKMDLETWIETYGRVVEAWLNGPARWLGMVQVALIQGRVVAFQRPSVVPGSLPVLPPEDVLRYLPDDLLKLRNTWQASKLRQLIRQIAVEVERTWELTTYCLDNETFRDTLQGGLDATQIIEAFAAAGSPLPSKIQATLHDWQAKAGRYQVYTNLAVIEFSDDLAAREIQAATSLGRMQLYSISPRCLLVLQPEGIPELIRELRQKGYTPQVVES